ncbi:MAG: twin-arginine translocase subunit TatC [Bacteroidales bacterium]|nr:twin-arginine translocase subunit TatC [Bacteroidales bacterium]
MNFWGHLEVLRWLLIRCAIVVLALAVVLFCFKDIVFGGIILAPCDGDFVTYRAMCRLGELLGMPGLCPDLGEIEMININLSSQLMTHLSVSIYLAAVIAMPYLITEAWLFVKPALYNKERRVARVAVVAFFFQFFVGLALAYFLIFPLTYNFLGNYQVSERIVNQISLSSYISTFVGLLLTMGLVFEMPIVAYFFARIGVLKASFLSKYRKVAIVLTLVLAAFITPSTDVFTMCLVAMPLYLLYEFSRWVVKRVEKRTIESS